MLAPVADEFPWMAVACAEQGISETPGAGNTTRVLEYLKATTLGHELAGQDATPWCSGFVNWCFARVGIAGTHSAAARSWMQWGVPLISPRRGCVAVFTRDGGGHVAFYVSDHADTIQVLGGNQDDRVCVRGYPRSRLIGYRLPYVSPGALRSVEAPR